MHLSYGNDPITNHIHQYIPKWTKKIQRLNKTWNKKFVEFIQSELLKRCEHVQRRMFLSAFLFSLPRSRNWHFIHSSTHSVQNHKRRKTLSKKNKKNKETSTHSFLIHSHKTSLHWFRLTVCASVAYIRLQKQGYLTFSFFAHSRNWRFTHSFIHSLTRSSFIHSATQNQSALISTDCSVFRWPARLVRYACTPPGRQLTKDCVCVSTKVKGASSEQRELFFLNTCVREHCPCASVPYNFSPDVILCGWLGLKHQLTPSLQLLKR